MAKAATFHRYRHALAARCPECGYPLEAMGQPVCAECGEPFPGPWNNRLRWARQRLPIERRRFRPIWLWAWAQSVMLVLFRPAHAAARLSVPDRNAATIAFMMLNLVIAAFLLSLGSSWAAALTQQWLAADVHILSGGAPKAVAEAPMRDLYAGWGAGFIVWLLILFTALLACRLALSLAPAERYATALTLRRWCDYLSALFLIPAGLVGLKWLIFALALAAVAADARPKFAPTSAPPITRADPNARAAGATDDDSNGAAATAEQELFSLSMGYSFDPNARPVAADEEGAATEWKMIRFGDQRIPGRILSDTDGTTRFAIFPRGEMSVPTRAITAIEDPNDSRKQLFEEIGSRPVSPGLFRPPAPPVAISARRAPGTTVYTPGVAPVSGPNAATIASIYTSGPLPPGYGRLPAWAHAPTAWYELDGAPTDAPTVFAWPVIVWLVIWLAIGGIANPHRRRDATLTVVTIVLSYVAIWACLSLAAPWWGLSLAVR